MKRKNAVFALLAAALAAATLLALRRPPPPPPVVLHPSVRQEAQVQRHLETLQQELGPEPPPEAPTRSGRPRLPPPASRKRRTLRLSEEDLNVYLAGNRNAQKMLAARGVQGVQLILSEPANLTIRAAVSVKGHVQNVQLDGHLTPDPKFGLRYVAAQAQVGRLPLPPTVVTTQANALAARFVKQMHGRLPLIVQNVQVQGKMLILTGLLVKRTSEATGRITPPAPASPRSASPARH